MNRTFHLLAGLTAAALLAGCANAPKSRPAAATVNAAPTPGVVAVSGFVRNDPLVLPPQGVSLAEAVVAAGLPPASRYEHSFILWGHDGVRYAVSVPLVQGTAVGRAAVADGDVLEFLTPEAAVRRGYLSDEGKDNLFDRIRVLDRLVTADTTAVFLRTVEGVPTIHLFPNTQVAVPPFDTEESRVAATRIPLAPDVPVNLLEPDELPFEPVGAPSAAAVAQVVAKCRVFKKAKPDDGSVQWPKLAGVLR